MEVTSIEQLKVYSQGQLVELPAFAEGQPFVVRLRRPSLMALVKSGKIPNALLTTANKLFLEKGVDEKDAKLMPQLLGVFEVLVDAALVAPTFKEIKEAGVQLTDDQMMFIFSYTQQGIKALERFHVGAQVDKCTGNEQAVQNAPELTAEH